MNVNDIIQFILSPPNSFWLVSLKIVFIALSAFLLGVIIFGLTNTLWFKKLILWDLQEFFTFRPFGVRHVVGDWLKIKARMDTGIESEYKLAVIEADAMLDDTLKRMGFGGESLGERLERLTIASLPNLEEIKAIHNVRNNIVHDPDYRLSLEEARRVIAVFEKSLTDLQAL
ncbi:MAG: hypothetical protein Q7K28_03010 [Candidatus Wildermuthbacteria bacterium]|nr:hypothetical protein [Candidatus Wildermuthbacteria bacterium]